MRSLGAFDQFSRGELAKRLRGLEIHGMEALLEAVNGEGVLANEVLVAEHRVHGGKAEELQLRRPHLELVLLVGEQQVASDGERLGESGGGLVSEPGPRSPP